MLHQIKEEHRDARASAFTAGLAFELVTILASYFARAVPAGSIRWPP